MHRKKVVCASSSAYLQRGQNRGRAIGRREETTCSSPPSRAPPRASTTNMAGITTIQRPKCRRTPSRPRIETRVLLASVRHIHCFRLRIVCWRCKTVRRLGARGRPRAAESVARRFIRGVIVQAVLVVPDTVVHPAGSSGWCSRARTRPRLLVELVTHTCSRYSHFHEPLS